MVVLSLFDGCSGAYMALSDLGINVKKYYASEIDNFAIKAAKLINPETIHLGDITKWKEWDINWSEINLIAAGSPCQGFSFAGKQLAFDDSRSKLFFEFINILNHVRKFNPDVKFFLENVIMKKENMRVINEYTGVIGQRINSALVSAQNRDRMYWSNISTIQSGLFSETHTYIEPPVDRGILLNDILQPESEVDEKYYLKNPKIGFEGMNLDRKSNCLRTSGKGSQSDKHNNDIIKVDKKVNKKANQDKASCFTAWAHSGGNHSDMDIILFNYKLRRLTPLECMRLQTIPERFQKILLESGISDSSLYKMMGNGWTIEVIKEYFKKT